MELAMVMEYTRSNYEWIKTNDRGKGRIDCHVNYIIVKNVTEYGENEFTFVMTRYDRLYVPGCFCLKIS